MGISIFPAPSAGGNSNLTTSDLATFASSQTRLSRLEITNTQVPLGITAGTNTVFALVVGGGGGGVGSAVNSARNNSGSGGSGGIAFGWVPYVSTLTATVGAGGAAGSNTAANGGGNGGKSYYAGLVATGGGGGQYNSASNQGKGSGGVFANGWQAQAAVSNTATWQQDGLRETVSSSSQGSTIAGQGGDNVTVPTGSAGSDGLFPGGAGINGNTNSGNVRNSGAGGGGGGVLAAGSAASNNAAGAGGNGGGGGGAGAKTARDIFNSGSNTSNNTMSGGAGGSGCVVIYY